MPRQVPKALLLPGALALVAAAFLLAGIALPAGRGFLFIFGLIVVGAQALAPFLLARLGLAVDRLSYVLIVILSGLGLFFLARLQLSEAAFGQLAQRQFVAFLLGLAAMGIGILVGRSYHALVQFRYLILFISLLFLSLTVVTPLGTEVGGSRAWLRLWGLTIQPSEFVRPVLVFFLASYFGQYQPLLRARGPETADFWRRRWFLGPVLAMWTLSLVVLWLQRDMGASVLYFAAFLVLLYLASGKTSYLCGGAALGAAGCLAMAAIFQHVRDRFLVWLHPLALASGIGYQNTQGLFALANGGLLGTGLGQGYFRTIPAVHTDMIFVAIAEEIGLMGALAVLLLFAALIVRCLVLASRSHDRVGYLLAAGLSFTMGLQILLIIGGSVGMLPLTGITLPLISSGGSSMVATLFCLGVISGIGRKGEVRGLAD